MHAEELRAHSLVIGGRKHFGRFQPVMEGVSPSSLCWSWAGPPTTISLHVPIFGRHDKTMVALVHLLRALTRAEVSAELVLTDSSFDRTFLRMLPILRASRPENLSRLRYYHDPFMTLASARTRALSLSAPESSFFATIDNDISLSEWTIWVLLNAFQLDDRLAALSVPLANRRLVSADALPSSRAAVSAESWFMPGSAGWCRGRLSFDDRVLLTPVVRGVVVVRRSSLTKLRAPAEPWNRHFTVLQNVAFSVELSAASLSAGHALDERAYGLHEESSSPYDVSGCRTRPVETLKAYVLTCFRSGAAIAPNSPFQLSAVKNLATLFRCGTREAQRMFRSAADLATSFSTLRSVREASAFASTLFRESLSVLERRHLRRVLFGSEALFSDVRATLGPGSRPVAVYAIPSSVEA